MSEPNEEIVESTQAALDNANRYFDMVDYVYPQSLEMSVKFGKLALGFAELLPITTRHITILDGLSHGVAKKEALALVGLSSFRMSEITDALAVKTTNQAIIRAFELGLLPPYKEAIEIDEITNSEMGVWVKLLAGLSREEIARQRGVNVNKVADQLSDLFAATGAVNQQQAIRIGLEVGIAEVEQSQQGQSNRALMVASVLTAVKLWSIVPTENYPEDVRYSELPPLALGNLYRGTRTMRYSDKIKKPLNLRRIGEIRGKNEPVRVIKTSPRAEYTYEKPSLAKETPTTKEPTVEQMGSKPRREILNNLTEDEKNVALLLAAGYAESEIAERQALETKAVMTYANKIRRAFGVSRNIDLATAIGPVPISKLPAPKVTEDTQAEGRKKFMWEDDFDAKLSGVIKGLSDRGANRDTIWSVDASNQQTLNLLMREGHIMADSLPEQLTLVEIVTALMLKTDQAKHLRRGAEWHKAASRKIREAVAGLGPSQS